MAQGCEGQGSFRVRDHGDEEGLKREHSGRLLGHLGTARQVGCHRPDPLGG